MSYKNSLPPFGSKPWGRKINHLKPNVIKERIDPLEFYINEVGKSSAARHGWVDGGLCPFHLDNKPGSFKVNLISGAYKCFSCGAGGGDVIDFTMALYGLSFRATVAKLTKEWGVSSC